MNTAMNTAGRRAHKHLPPTTPAPHPATLSHPPKKELEPGGVHMPHHTRVMSRHAGRARRRGEPRRHVSA